MAKAHELDRMVEYIARTPAVRDVVALETLGEGQVRWETSVEDGLPAAQAREMISQ